MTTAPAGPHRLLATEHHATYPHANGYTPDGRSVVLASSTPEGPRLVVADLRGEQPLRTLTELRSFGEPRAPRYWSSPVSPLAVPWWDIAQAADVLVCPWRGQILRVDLRSGEADVAWKAPSGWELSDIASVTSDGTRAALAVSDGSRCRLVEVDLATGAATTLLEVDWYLNHVHHVPADERWIAFSHEGRHAAVHDRIWVWHAELAPKGRVVLDQHALSDLPGTPVSVGHERWLRHDVAALVPVYGDSPAGPRGLWQVHADGRPPRLISPGDRDWHVGAGPDGAWAVLDTTGPAERPGLGWQGADGATSIVAVDLVTGERTTLAQTGFEQHPYHPHPSITPDGTAVLANVVDVDAAGGVRRGVALLDLPARRSPSVAGSRWPGDSPASH